MVARMQVVGLFIQTHQSKSRIPPASSSRTLICEIAAQPLNLPRIYSPPCDRRLCLHQILRVCKWEKGNELRAVTSWCLPGLGEAVDMLRGRRRLRSYTV